MMDHRPLPRRFLFLFSDTGGGHRTSAQAVREELIRRHGPAAHVELLDIFTESNRWPFHRFPDWYPRMVRLHGIPWGIGFHLLDRVEIMQGMSRLLWPYTREQLCALLTRHPADVIVSFHPVPNCAVNLALRHLGWRGAFVIVAVDLITAHAGWFVPGANLYLVPTEQARARARRWGVPAGRVCVTGMPVRRAFVDAAMLPQEEARHRLGLPQDRPLVLVVGGGDGMGRLKAVAQALMAQDLPAHLVVIAGRNRKLQAELSAMASPGTRIEGFVSQMALWMRAADILVTKAGPNTLAEACVAGLPMVLYAALPGQEEGNIGYVVDHGAGIWASSPRRAAEAVLELLHDGALRAAMAHSAQALARPSATEEIVRHLWAQAESSVPAHRLNPPMGLGRRLYHAMRPTMGRT